MPYLVEMGIYADSRRVAAGHRIVHHTMPARLIAELDLVIAAERLHDRWFNRSTVTAKAIRRFLNQGGLRSVQGDPLSSYRNDRRRHTQFHVPAALVVEYNTTPNPVLTDADRYQSWEVVALAIRRFLDQGAMSLMDQADEA